MAGYGASAIKRRRRTDAIIEAIEDEIVRIVSDDHPMTLRHVFYRLAAIGMIEKTDADYKTTGRYLLKLRREGRVPYAWISDNTRWRRKARRYPDLQTALAFTAQHYKRELFAAQNAYCELWCEKDAIAGLLIDETDAYDVSLMVARGFSSETFLYSAAREITRDGRPAYLYLLTDLDPAGLRIAADVETRIRRMAPGADITVQRLGVTREQVLSWNLPTRPTKGSARDFAGDSVDLDAIPPRRLRQLVRDALERHIDRELLERELRIEALERASAMEIAAAFAR